MSSAPRWQNRWVQLAAGAVAMMAIANMQYAWTLFTKPLTTNLHASLAAIQVAFSAFVLTETWLVPVEGYLIDRLGPRLVMSFGSVLVALGWIGAGTADSVRGLIAWYALGGVGAGAVYGATVGNAMKWFPDHRGLCVGITAGAYGAGTALTVAPIAAMISSSGYARTFVIWGIIQGLAVLAAALFVSPPPADWQPPLPSGHPQYARLKKPVASSSIDMTPRQMLRTEAFWVIYAMMTIVAFGGLVVTAQLNPIAQFYGVDKIVVAFGMSALVLAIQVDRILNGLTRPFWGWVSDHIGREMAMFIAFNVQAAAIIALLLLIKHPVWFVVLSGLCFFAWGEIFSLFPAITGDLFGKKWATTNYGIVYTAKGLASIFAGPVAALAQAATGTWVPIFCAMILCDVLAAFMALLWLKPLAARIIRGAQESVQPQAAASTAGTAG